MGGVPCQAQPKPVMVHYMPWFQAPNISGLWGYHWTYNTYFNPNIITNGERQIGSWYYPLIGPYDSLDPVVLEYHVLLMKLGGIDGVIVDWYGPDNYYDYAINNARTLAIFNYAQKAGLKAALCYEDSTIASEIAGGTNGGTIPLVTAANSVAHAQQTMLYVQSNYFADPNYFRMNNEPVLLNFGPQYFTTNAGWVSIFSVLNATNQPEFFTEDNRLAVGGGAFDWPPMSLSQPSGGSNVLSDATLQGYLNTFQQKGASWPAFVSSAFPRFHDIYGQAGGTSYGYLSDNNGVTFQETLTRALTNNSSIIQLVTWNDFGEGTIIEPTVQYGYRDLGVVQNFRRQYLNPSFPYHTNDLNLALRLYNMRRAYGTSNAVVSAELNRVFSNIVSGNLTAANLELTGVETNVPAIYNLALSGGQLQFSVGGYLSPNGIQIQTSSNLSPGGWQTLETLVAGTNLILFDTNIVPQNTATFFRIMNK
jgi:Glycosyl hydrolase family 99